MAESAPREYSRRMVWVPREVPINGTKHTAFRTADGDIDVRNGDTQTIRRMQPKVKGKAARRADKQARRSAKAHG